MAVGATAVDAAEKAGMGLAVRHTGKEGATSTVETVVGAAGPVVLAVVVAAVGAVDFEPAVEESDAVFAVA